MNITLRLLGLPVARIEVDATPLIAALDTPDSGGHTPWLATSVQLSQEVVSRLDEQNAWVPMSRRLQLAANAAHSSAVGARSASTS